MKPLFLLLFGACLTSALAENIVTNRRDAPLAAVSSQISIPLVVQGGGWTQQFILQNVGDDPLEGLIYFRDQGGFPWSVSIEGIGAFSSLELTLIPKETITFQTVLSFDDLQLGFALFDFDPNYEFLVSPKIGLQTILSLYSRSTSTGSATPQPPNRTGQGLPSGRDDTQGTSTPMSTPTSDLVLLGRTAIAVGGRLHASFLLFFDNRDDKNTQIAIQTPFPCFDLIGECDTSYILRIRSLSGLVVLEDTFVQRNQTMNLVDLAEAFPALAGHAGSLEFVAPAEPFDVGPPPLLHLDVMALQFAPDTFTALHAVGRLN